MGDDVKLQCSTTQICSGTENLHDVFINRFKLPDDFWKDLLNNNYSERFSYGKELVTNLITTPTSPKDIHANFKTPNSQSVVVENESVHFSDGNFKTVQIKPGYSPSLFSPTGCGQNGIAIAPSSSTPLPLRPLKNSNAVLCQSGTKTPNQGFKTPLTALLNERYNDQDTTPKVTRSLSASLEMDSVGYTSWTSSLATPPKGIDVTSAHDVVENDCELINNRSSKGVARVLFQRQPQGLEQTFGCDNVKFDDSDLLQSSLCMYPKEFLDYAEKTSNDSFEKQDISCAAEGYVMAISPIINLTQSKIDKTFGNSSPDYFNDSVDKALVDLPIMTGIPKSIASREELGTELPYPMTCKDKVNPVVAVNSTSVNSGALEDTPLKNNMQTNNENIYDMDTLSELPFDFVTPERNKSSKYESIREIHERVTQSCKLTAVINAQTNCDAESTSTGKERNLIDYVPCERTGETGNQNKLITRKLETASQILLDLNSSRFRDIIHEGVDDLRLPQVQFEGYCDNNKKQDDNLITTNTAVIEEHISEKPTVVAKNHCTKGKLPRKKIKVTNCNSSVDSDYESHVNGGQSRDSDVSSHKVADEYDLSDQCVKKLNFNKETVPTVLENSVELITDKFESYILKIHQHNQIPNAKEYIQESSEKSFGPTDNIHVTANKDKNVLHANRNRTQVSEDQNPENITNFNTITNDSMSNDIDNKGINRDPGFQNAENFKNGFRKKLPEKAEMGFMTASGKDIKVSERSLEKAKSILIDIDKEEGFSSGHTDISRCPETNEIKVRPREMVKVCFSTASGKKIIISESAIERARKFLDDDSEVETTEAFICDNVNDKRHENVKNLEEDNDVEIFGNMKGKVTRNSWDGKEIVNVKSNTSNCDMNLSSSTGNNQEKGIEAHERVEVGFSTASGKKVVISEKAIEEARKFLTEEVKISERETAPCKKGEKILPNHIKRCGKNRHSDVSGNTRNQGKRVESHERAGIGFSTASGKKVVISEKAMEQARPFLAEIPEGTPFCNEVGNGLPIHGIRNGKIARHNAIEYSEDVNNKGNEVTPDRTGNIGFSTASGEKVVISEKAIARAREFLDEENEIPEEMLFCGRIPKTLPNTFKNCETEILIKGLEMSENITESNPEEVKLQGKINVGFSTASGKKVIISEKAVELAREFLAEENEIPDHSCNKGGKMSHTNERENHVNTSETIIGLRKTSVDEKKTGAAPRGRDCDVTGYNGNNQESGVESYKRAKIGFSTTSGKKVVISEKAMEKARTFLTEGEKPEFDDCYSKATCLKNNQEKILGFQTASGRKVEISEKSISEARKFLSAESACAEQKLDDCDKQPHLADIQAMKTAGFLTASGKKVAISDESIEKAKAIFTEVDKELDASLHFKSRHGYNMEKLAKHENCSNSEQQFLSAFSTASGKGVHVTKKSLTKARTILSEVDNHMNQVDKSATKEKIAGNAVERLVEAERRCVVVGFQTAGGTDVLISEKALEKGKALLKEVEDAMETKTDHDDDSNCIIDYENISHGIIAKMSSEITVSSELFRVANKLTNTASDGTELSLTEKITENNPRVCIAYHNSRRHPPPKIDSSDSSTLSVESIEMTCKDDAKRLPKLQFSSGSGKNVVVSEEALKCAKNLLHDASHDDLSNSVKCTQNNNLSSTEISSRRDCTGSKSLIHKVTSVHSRRLLNKKDGATHVAAHSNFEDMSERTRDEISESSSMLLLDESFMDLSQILGCQTDSKEIERKSNKNCNSETTKRQLEAEYENVPPGKFSRIEAEEPNSKRQNSEQHRKIIRKPYNANPIEVHCDRSYSNLRSPIKPLVVSPNDRSVMSREQTTDQYSTPQNNKQNYRGLKCDQSMNGTTPSKRKSRFVTPYRKKAREKSEKNEPIVNLKSKNRKGRSDSKKDKHLSNKPVPGSIFKLRNSLSFKRISLRGYVKSEFGTHSTTELLQLGIQPSILSISCSNAGSFRFKACDYLSNAACDANSGVRFADGAIVFLGTDKCIGIEECSSAFMSSPGVDSSLIDDRWIANHYKWIVWKLASYEVAYPRIFLGRCLSPDMVLRQLKYRYDREVDRCERSAVKKILERDDAASRAMVLCVSDMNICDEQPDEGEHQAPVASNFKEHCISMTDGWYSIRVQLDGYLKSLVDAGKIFKGQKLYTQGAELIGSDQAVSPLEAPRNLRLRIHGNSTRPAKNFSRLGFHCTNNVFTVPVKSLSCEGGLVSCILVIVARQYPLQFMEKQPDGSCVFRNPRCEERVAKMFERNVQEKREKIMHQVQTEMENEETVTKKPKRRKTGLSSSEKIIGVFDGKELYDIINNATDPCNIQNSLSDEQARIVEKYKRSLQENKTIQMRQRYEEAWKKLCEEETLERNVVPVLKVKLIDSMPQKNNETTGTALLTVWRPSEHIITALEEGKRLKIYNTNASRYSKGSNTIQLSANRSTIYKEAPNNPICQCDFQPRKVYDLDELSCGIKPATEVDIVAVVISFRIQENLTTVYLSDSCFNFVRLKIWRGLEEQALDNIIEEKIFIGACNLVYQPDKYFGIPSLKYYELSVVTTNPSNKMLKQKLGALKNTIKNLGTFVSNAKAKLDNICSKSTPSGSSRPCETENKSGVSSAVGSESVRQSRKRLLQLKRKKLDYLPNLPPLSPLPNATTPNVRKEYKIPRRIPTETIENA